MYFGYAVSGLKDNVFQLVMMKFLLIYTFTLLSYMIITLVHVILK